jgi:hypothetical protein
MELPQLPALTPTISSGPGGFAGVYVRGKFELDVSHLYQRDVQCVLNAEINDGPTMRYSSISKNGMLSSPTNSEDPPQPPTPAVIGLGPGPDICGTPQDKSRSNTISHSSFGSSSSLAFASADAVAALESEGRGDTGSDRISRDSCAASACATLLRVNE